LVVKSPDETLVGVLHQPDTAARILLITGPSGSGKTRWCLELVDSARRRGLKVAGLISPAVFEGGSKTGINLLDVESGEQRCLARRKGTDPEGIVVGSWTLDPEVLDWGNRVLGTIRRTPILVLDEIGPLELKSDHGLNGAFALVDSHFHRLACITIRPSLLPTALERWAWAQVLTLPSPLEAA
jgi:nucleoside-triphosphatase THEP1